MIIKAVKFRKNGFYGQPFAFGGEEGPDKFDKNIRYRGSLQNYLTDTGNEVILLNMTVLLLRIFRRTGSVRDAVRVRRNSTKLKHWKKPSGFFFCQKMPVSAGRMRLFCV